MSNTMQEMQTDIGLVNTIVARSALSFIDGENGVLEYVGYDIDDLARNSTFEETTFLLWNKRLPSRSELTEFTEQIRTNYDLSDRMWDIIVSLPRDASPMHALRTLTSALSLEDPGADDPSEEANARKSLAMLSKMCGWFHDLPVVLRPTELCSAPTGLRLPNQKQTNSNAEEMQPSILGQDYIAQGGISLFVYPS